MSTVHRICLSITVIFGLWFWPIATVAQEQGADSGSQLCCSLTSSTFEDEIWAKVGERICLRCHNNAGEAKDSQFILQRPVLGTLNSSLWMRENEKAFSAMAQVQADEGSSSRSRLVAKALGDLEHGGGEVLKNDPAARVLLEKFEQSFRQKNAPEQVAAIDEALANDDFFRDLVFLSPPQKLRRVTLSLVGRLPHENEIQIVAEHGYDGVLEVLETLTNENAFYERLKEAFNDVFLTLGIEDNAETLLSYHHFEKTRLWYQQWDFSNLPESERERAGWKMADVYRQALLQEPLQMIEYIVRNNRPFSELLTADYIMVSPYTARGYGIFEAIQDQFQDVNNPFEYIPAKLPALVGRDGKVQDSKTGLYPHAGLLSMFHYLRRYPSTETNRNRLRARMFYQHFLGIDIMQLAPRSTDATAVAAQYEVPTMQAADCVVCHRTIDPVASIFQDYDFEGHLIPRKEGWYQDMFQAGFEGQIMPAEEHWRSAQWLAEQTVKDPRFAVAMVEHVYYLLFGRRVLQAPNDIDDPYFRSKRRAYLAQRKLIEEVSQQFIQHDLNLKIALCGLIKSRFYEIDSLQAVRLSNERKMELDDLGLVRLLSPEQLERKIKAIFGQAWGRLEEDTAILYGGIDSITITERNADPSGAMGAIQRILANDVSCLNVAEDFRRPETERLLFPNIEPDVVPGSDESNDKILRAIIHLHERILGQHLPPNDPEIQRTFDLFRMIIQEANEQGFEPRETYYCGGRDAYQTSDPKYAIRAWRAVVTYLLRQHSFLYE